MSAARKGGVLRSGWFWGLAGAPRTAGRGVRSTARAGVVHHRAPPSMRISSRGDQRPARLAEKGRGRRRARLFCPDVDDTSRRASGSSRSIGAATGCPRHIPGGRCSVGPRITSNAPRWSCPVVGGRPVAPTPWRALCIAPLRSRRSSWRQAPRPSTRSHRESIFEPDAEATDDALPADAVVLEPARTCMPRPHVEGLPDGSRIGSPMRCAGAIRPPSGRCGGRGRPRHRRRSRTRRCWP